MNKGNEGTTVVVYATAGHNLATTMVTWSLHLHLQLAPQRTAADYLLHAHRRPRPYRPSNGDVNLEEVHSSVVDDVDCTA